MDPLWFRMANFARQHDLPYGLGVDSTSHMIVAHMGRAMGRGPTSNEAINRCADELVTLHDWPDDRHG